MLLNSRVVRLSVASLGTGLLIGIVGGIFRVLLLVAEHLRSAFVGWAHAWPYIGWLGPVTMGLICAALARLMVVRLSPQAEGSGLQNVEAVFSGEANRPIRRFCPSNSSAASWQLAPVWR